ncbi:hypothetical protein ACSLVN_27365, partial [Klebsiella pneumoniae]|uniref:hypothetical protein n=1 Tax=Klebsiella pneumoniae TaxID=573 RepID=UPI003EE363D5
RSQQTGGIFSPPSKHLKLPTVLDVVDDMQPPLQLTLPAKTPEKKQLQQSNAQSSTGGKNILPLPPTGLTPNS